MSFRTLPNVVLAIVLEKVAHSRDKHIGVFGGLLLLLAVCRQWRHIALPIVYADAYYMFEREESPRYDRVIGRPISRKPVKRCEDTNVDLIASAGCINKVKRVHINLNLADSLFPGILMAVTRLSEVAAVWTRVEYLYVGQRSSFDLVPAKKVQAMAKRLIGMFPGVRQLEMTRINDYSASNGLDTLLVAGYAEQLRVYNGYPVLLPPGRLLERLERADVTFHGNSGHNQVIQPSQLEHLRITPMRLSCPWDTFTDGGGSGNQSVVFPNLKSLQLRHGWTGPRPATAHHHRLHFPQLQSLDLQYKSNACELLQHAVFPTHMARLVLSAPEAAFEFLCGVEFPTVEQLTVTVSDVRFRSQELGHVGRFLSRMRSNKQDLVICSYAPGLLPELVQCTRLASVTVDSLAGIELVVAVAVQLPFLQKLELVKVLTGLHSADMSISPPDAHEPVEPLNSNLQVLTLRFEDRSSARDTAAAAQYLLMRLPNLTVFSVTGVSAEPVLGFAREYSRFYPHLENAESVFFGR